MFFFFYDKLQYLYERQVQLVAEMKRRGFTVNFEPDGLVEFKTAKPDLWNNWVPNDTDKAINQARINERLKGMNV